MIKKITFRNEVKKALLKAMLKGQLVPGQRINLPDIAGILEVSVTPVREALTQLAETGIVSYIANRGFIVSELSLEEAVELYEVIAILEASALENSDFDGEILEELEAYQHKFESAAAHEERVYCDMIFHQKLIEHCPNQLIKKLIEDMRIRVFFYEMEYMSIDNLKEVSDNSHRLLLQHLRNHEPEKAAQELRRNWQLSIDQVLAGMDQ